MCDRNAPVMNMYVPTPVGGDDGVGRAPRVRRGVEQESLKIVSTCDNMD